MSNIGKDRACHTAILVISSLLHRRRRNSGFTGLSRPILACCWCAVGTTAHSGGGLVVVSEHGFAGAPTIVGAFLEAVVAPLTGRRGSALTRLDCRLHGSRRGGDR